MIDRTFFFEQVETAEPLLNLEPKVIIVAFTPTLSRMFKLACRGHMFNAQKCNRRVGFHV